MHSVQNVGVNFLYLSKKKKKVQLLAPGHCSLAAIFCRCIAAGPRVSGKINYGVHDQHYKGHPAKLWGSLGWILGGYNRPLWHRGIRYIKLWLHGILIGSVHCWLKSFTGFINNKIYSLQQGLQQQKRKYSTRNKGEDDQGIKRRDKYLTN